LKLWSTDPLEVNTENNFKFAFELTLQDTSSQYYFIPYKPIGEDFIKDPIRVENLQEIFIF